MVVSRKRCAHTSRGYKLHSAKDIRRKVERETLVPRRELIGADRHFRIRSQPESPAEYSRTEVAFIAWTLNAKGTADRRDHVRSPGFHFDHLGRNGAGKRQHKTQPGRTKSDLARAGVAKPRRHGVVLWIVCSKRKGSSCRRTLLGPAVPGQGISISRSL